MSSELSIKPLTINKQALLEMQQIAITERSPGVDSLNYAEFQQVITLQALSKWISSHGIEPQFDFELT